MLYQMYRLSRWVAMRLLRRVSYRIGLIFSDLHYLFSHEDRRCVAKNLACILGENHPDIPGYSRQVFGNFAKYLVDFFRFEKFDEQFLSEHIQIIGEENVDEAVSGGKGAILLSAHLGNYELAALVARKKGPVTAIVLTHQDPQIDSFFTCQRRLSKVNPIPVGMSLRAGFKALRRGEFLGVVGDRDFFDNGLKIQFLGKEMSAPKGPAIFSVRTGAPIVPTTLIREPNDDFRMIYEKPIYPRAGADEQEEIERLTRESVAVLERYVKENPTQWYFFREFWNPGPWIIR